MNRREFVAATIALGALAQTRTLYADSPLMRADMHSHWGMAASRGTGELNIGEGLRQEMLGAGLILVAINVMADYPQITRQGSNVIGFEHAAPGTLRRYFERMTQAVKARAQRDQLAVVGGIADLDALIKARQPGIAMAAEGADFLEGELDYLETARAAGVCHLQLVHYRLSYVGDISNQAPKHKGLSDFGKEVVRACNRLGMLVDVAHCSSSGIRHALEVSTRPIIYSHGWISDSEPHYASRNARAIHAPLAREIAAKGGVIGAFPLHWSSPEDYADYLLKLVATLGAAHVGIGTDHSGLPNSAISGYRDFPRVALALSRGGLNESDVAAVMGGNYLRLLRQAMLT